MTKPAKEYLRPTPPPRVTGGVPSSMDTLRSLLPPQQLGQTPRWKGAQSARHPHHGRAPILKISQTARPPHPTAVGAPAANDGGARPLPELPALPPAGPMGMALVGPPCLVGMADGTPKLGPARPPALRVPGTPLGTPRGGPAASLDAGRTAIPQCLLPSR
jgi:hypothetical protein